jgi:hypothetical protein
VIQLLLAGALFAVFWTTGALLCAAGRRRPRGGAGLALRALVGALAWVTALAILSGFGLSAPQGAAVTAAAHVLPLGIVVSRRVRGGVRRRRPSPPGSLLLPSALLASALVSLLPVLLTAGFASANDTWLYCAFSEWLQDHPFLGPAQPDPGSPLSGPPVLYRRWGFSLAATQAVALAEAASGRSALEVYPAVSALAVALSVAGVFLAARWGLRLTDRRAAGAALAFAVLPHPLVWGHHNGFLSQAWATAALLLFLALLGRASRPRAWRGPEALTVGLALAFLALAYLPFVPVAGFAAAAHVAVHLVRARRAGALPRLAGFWGAAALVALALSRFDPAGLARGFGVLLSVPVGGHVGLTARELAEFAMGVRALGVDTGPALAHVLEWVTPLLSLVGLLLLLAGAATGPRKPARVPLSAALALFVGGIVYQALFRLDPWTGERGHTWGVFKLLQWQYPLVLLLQAAGLIAVRNRLSRRGEWRVAIPAVALAAALAGAVLLVHVPWARRLGRSQAALLQEDRPLEAVPRLRRALGSLPPGRLLLVGRPSNRHVFFGAHLALLAWPRPIVGDWKGSAGLESMEIDTVRGLYEEGLADAAGPGWVPVSCQGLPPSERGAPLGGGCFTLPPRSGVRLVGVESPGEETWPAYVGSGRTKVLVLSSSETDAVLRVRLGNLRPGEDRSLAAFFLEGDYDPQAVKRATAGQPLYEAAAGSAEEHKVRLSLPRGLSTILLALRSGTGELFHDPSSRLRVEAIGVAGESPTPR